MDANVGLPGSGKSYTVVENVILPALKAYREVWTNIPVNVELLEKDIPGCAIKVFSIDECKSNPRWFLDVLPKGVILVLDECWRLWPSGLKTNNAEPAHKEFLAEHRHLVGESGYSTEIVLVTQDLAQLAAFVRQLVSRTNRVSKLWAIGTPKNYRVDVFQGVATLNSAPEKRIMRKLYGRYRPEVYRYYKSHTKSEIGTAGLEEAPDKRGSVWKSGTVMIGLPVAVLAIVWGASGAVSFFNPSAPAAVPASAPAPGPLRPPEHLRVVDRPASAPVAPAASPAPPAPKGPAYSSIWRYAGYLAEQALITNDRGVVLRVPLTGCDQRSVDDVRCEVDGELVTAWTGQRPAFEASSGPLRVQQGQQQRPDVGRGVIEGARRAFEPLNLGG